MTDRVAIARLRQGLYRFFGGALIAPDEERLGNLTAAARYLNDLGVEAYAFYGPWSRLIEVVDEVSFDDDLSAEYVRLFGSGVDNSFSPPIESYYRASAKGGGVAELVAAVERDYRELGLAAIGGAEGPDHVATELEAMSALCDREAEAWEADQAALAAVALADQERFLRRRLSGWFPAFRARVQGAKPARFYGALVEAAHAFVVDDFDLVKAMWNDLEVNK